MEVEAAKAISIELESHIDSLRYAKVIQESLLPKPRHFDRNVEDHFIFYQPLNIVSGDFYWLSEKKDNIYIAVGDCTGHGVPGAMLSILAKSILDYSVLKKGILEPHLILQEVDKRFLESFSGIHEDIYDNDWFDIGLIKIDKNTKTVTYSAANRKLVHISVGKTTIHNGNRFPIGGWQYSDRTEFKAVTFNYSEGDMLYLGSDGYQDQIGGEKFKKFSSKRLHETLGKINHLPCGDQLEILQLSFDRWKNHLDQIDDVCLMGLRL